MTRAELLAEARAVLADTRGPKYNWSDDRLLRWMAEGQDRFCEQTGYIRDNTSFTITTLAGTKRYAIPSFDRIIEIRDVWDGTRRLQPFSQKQRPDVEPFTQNPSRPSLYQLDLGTGYLDLYGEPEAGIVLTLEVWTASKKPLNNKTGGNYDAEPEIPAPFHLALVEYAAGKAYNDHGSEALDPAKALDHMAIFADYVSRGKRAYSRSTHSFPDLAPNPQYVV